MVSMAVNDAQGAPMPQLLDYALERDVRMRTGIAPAQGLFFEMSDLLGYITTSGMKTCPSWIGCKTESDAMQWRKVFLETYVLKHIFKGEAEESR